MNTETKRLFEPNPRAFYRAKDGSKRPRGVGCGDNVREIEAVRQAELNPTPITEVIKLCNEFVGLMQEVPEAKRMACIEPFYLSTNTNGLIIDNILLVSGGKWISEFSQSEHRYTKVDRKYRKIEEKFELDSFTDIVWVVFTENGFVKVVGKGADLFQTTKTNDQGEIALRTAEKLVRFVHDKSNLTCAIIIPVNRKKLKFSTEKVELGLGNYLISKGVAIIDYFSHNY